MGYAIKATMSTLITICSVISACAVPQSANTPELSSSLHLNSLSEASSSTSKGDSRNRPSLPSGPGILLPSSDDYEVYLAEMAELGFSEDYLVKQDVAITDLKQEVSFKKPTELAGRLEPLVITAGRVLSDNLVVAQFTGDSCKAVVGGSVIVGETVDLRLYGGQLAGECLARNYDYRITLYIEGAAEQTPVSAFGTPLPSTEVVPPLLADLTELVIWPDELPAA
jgi:hypothetical protein